MEKILTLIVYIVCFVGMIYYWHLQNIGSVLMLELLVIITILLEYTGKQQ